MREQMKNEIKGRRNECKMGYLQENFGPKQPLKDDFTVENFFWPLDQNMGEI